MDLLTRTELELLAQPGPEGPHVSLFMPTHRFGSDIEADKLRWKNLVTGVEDLLLQRLRRPDVEALLAPARDLQDNAMAWQYMSDGLAMFLRPDGQRTFRVPAPMPELATVGDRTVMGPMLRLFAGDERFLLLALSQREIRLMEGSRNTVEQIQLAEVPTSLAEVVDPQEPRSDTMARAAAGAGRGGPAVFYGHGAGDRHLKKDEVVRFLRQVSSGLREVLEGETAPLVLFGLEPLVVTYREVNAYEHLLDEAVVHSSDQLSIEQLHERSWPLVEQRLRTERGQVIERFHGLRATGRVSSDLGTVAEAATEGRVETLFVQADPWCWEQVAGNEAAIVELGSDERYAEFEQVDRAAVATLNNGGRVYATSQTVVPDSPVAAIFLY
ncbi:MAG: hypothetical protein L0H96_08225 [Humibacillus sp.]|nr:hypothetical protein [Humibacillus sp.]MDN5776880.1 hypothetical protein [Humibacillus sp.]